MVFSFWNISVFLLYSSRSLEIAHSLTRYVHLGLSLMYFSFYLFCTVFTDSINEKGVKRQIIISLLTSMAFVLVALFKNEWWMTDLVQYSWGHTPLIGKAGWVYTFFYAFYLFQGFKLLWLKMIGTKGRYRLQISFMFFSLLVLYILGITNFFPTIGMAVPPMANVFSLPVILAIFYSVVKHETFEIRFLYLRALSFFILFLWLSAGSFVLMVFTQLVFTPLFHENQIFFLILFSFLLALVIKPLLGSLDFLDKLFKKTYTKTRMSDTFAFLAVLKQNLNTPGKTMLFINDQLLTTLNYDFVVFHFSREPSFVLQEFKLNHPEQIGIEESIFDTAFFDSAKEVFNILKTNYLDKDILYYQMIRSQEMLTKNQLKNLLTQMDSKKAYVIIYLEKNLYSAGGFIVLGLLNDRVIEHSEAEIIQSLITPIQISMTVSTVYEEALENQKALDRMERIAVLGRMNQGIAHEIKNPMMAIKSYFELMPTLNEKEREQFSLITRGQVDRINLLLRKLLDYTQPEKLDLETVSLSSFIERIALFLKPQFDSSQVSFEWDIPKSIHIKMDRYKFEQVVINLLQNAIQAKDEYKEKSWIKVEYRQHRLFISDNGMGISNENLDKIFTPFFSTKKGSGTGLGLSLAQNIVFAHGWTIEVKSKPKEMTIFQIAFSF